MCLEFWFERMERMEKMEKIGKELRGNVYMKNNLSIVKELDTKIWIILVLFKKKCFVENRIRKVAYVRRISINSKVHTCKYACTSLCEYFACNFLPLTRLNISLCDVSLQIFVHLHGFTLLYRDSYTSLLGMHSTSHVNGIPIAPIVSHSEKKISVFATDVRIRVKIFHAV